MSDDTSDEPTEARDPSEPLDPIEPGTIYPVDPNVVTDPEEDDESRSRDDDE